MRGLRLRHAGPGVRSELTAPARRARRERRLAAGRAERGVTGTAHGAPHPRTGAGLAAGRSERGVPARRRLSAGPSRGSAGNAGPKLSGGRRPGARDRGNGSAAPPNTERCRTHGRQIRSGRSPSAHTWSGSARSPANGRGLAERPSRGAPQRLEGASSGGAVRGGTAAVPGPAARRASRRLPEEPSAASPRALRIRVAVREREPPGRLSPPGQHGETCRECALCSAVQLSGWPSRCASTARPNRQTHEPYM